MTAAPRLILSWAVTGAKKMPEGLFAHHLARRTVDPDTL
jgi:hypothetical protein